VTVNLSAPTESAEVVAVVVVDARVVDVDLDVDVRAGALVLLGALETVGVVAAGVECSTLVTARVTAAMITATAVPITKPGHGPFVWRERLPCRGRRPAVQSGSASAVSYAARVCLDWLG
jgi:hypothetical protein